MRVEQIDQKPHRQSQRHDSVQYNRHAFIPLVVLLSFPFFAFGHSAIAYRLLHLCEAAPRPSPERRPLRRRTNAGCAVIFPTRDAFLASPARQQRMKNDLGAGLRATSRISLNHFGRNFMPWKYRIGGAHGQLHAMQQMQVGAADAACQHLQARPAGRARFLRCIFQQQLTW